MTNTFINCYSVKDLLPQECFAQLLKPVSIFILPERTSFVFKIWVKLILMQTFI